LAGCKPANVFAPRHPLQKYLPARRTRRRVRLPIPPSTQNQAMRDAHAIRFTSCCASHRVATPRRRHADVTGGL